MLIFLYLFSISLQHFIQLCFCVFLDFTRGCIRFCFSFAEVFIHVLFKILNFVDEMIMFWVLCSGFPVGNSSWRTLLQDWWIWVRIYYLGPLHWSVFCYVTWTYGLLSKVMYLIWNSSLSLLNENFSFFPSLVNFRSHIKKLIVLQMLSTDSGLEKMGQFQFNGKQRSIGQMRGYSLASVLALLQELCLGVWRWVSGSKF